MKFYNYKPAHSKIQLIVSLIFLSSLAVQLPIWSAFPILLLLVAFGYCIGITNLYVFKRYFSEKFQRKLSVLNTKVIWYPIIRRYIITASVSTFIYIIGMFLGSITIIGLSMFLILVLIPVIFVESILVLLKR